MNAPRHWFGDGCDKPHGQPGAPGDWGDPQLAVPPWTHTGPGGESGGAPSGACGRAISGVRAEGKGWPELSRS